MKIYQEHDNGAYSFQNADGSTTSFRESNYLFDEMQKEIAANKAQLKPIEAKPVEVLELEAKQTAKMKLSETDWYVIRSIETGKPVPDDILQLRASIRENA